MSFFWMERRSLLGGGYCVFLFMSNTLWYGLERDAQRTLHVFFSGGEREALGVSAIVLFFFFFFFPGLVFTLDIEVPLTLR